MRSAYQGRPKSHSLRLSLQAGILNQGHAAAEGVAHAAGPLLEHMRQLMGDQALAVGRSRIEPSWSEVDVRPLGEGQSSQGRDRRTLMNSYG